MRTLLLTEHTDLTLGGKKTKQSSRSQRENTIPAEKERGERERSGEEEPQKVHIQGREKDRDNPNQPCASLAQNSLKAFHVCTWGGKKAVAVGREKKTLCERERERASKNHPGKTKYQRKKLKKLDHLIPKPCTVNFLVPNYVPKRNTHTHTHKEGFFSSSTELCKKKKKTEEEEEEEEEERRRNRAGEGG
jgi:hypothetical protein